MQAAQSGCWATTAKVAMIGVNLSGILTNITQPRESAEQGPVAPSLRATETGKPA